MSRSRSFARVWDLRRAVLAGAAAAGVAAAPAQLMGQALDSATVAGMRWRTVGPATFMGRLSDVVGIPSPSKTVAAS